jgi:heme exporter protein C
MGRLDKIGDARPAIPLALRLGLIAWMAALAVWTLRYVPPAEGFADPRWARLVIAHVPCAMLAVLAYVVSTVYAIVFLAKGSMASDMKSAVSAKLGFAFTMAATGLGMIFARIEWGSAWNWDPRETTILMLMLVYAAYFALRAAIPGAKARARISAAYNVLACVVMPFFVFVLPRIMGGLHPNSAHLSLEYRIALRAGMLGFLWLYIWLFRSQVGRLERKVRKQTT